MPKKTGPIRILCLACSPVKFSALQAAFKNAPHVSILTASTSDQAVAICVAQVVAAAVVDAESIRGQEWSVLKSLKGVKPSLPIILLEERKSERHLLLPEGVDATASLQSPTELYEVITAALDRASKKERPAAS